MVIGNFYSTLNILLALEIEFLAFFHADII